MEQLHDKFKKDMQIFRIELMLTQEFHKKELLNYYQKKTYIHQEHGIYNNSNISLGFVDHNVFLATIKDEYYLCKHNFVYVDFTFHIHLWQHVLNLRE